MILIKIKTNLKDYTNYLPWIHDMTYDWIKMPQVYVTISVCVLGSISIVHAKVLTVSFQYVSSE